MPAQSKAQQRFMGMVHAVQKGDMQAPSKEVEKAADSMTKKDAKDYASTSHKGLPNKKENMNITRERLKELVKEVMTEESEYQAFFQKALDKAGKDINAMSDEEKKSFFNKIDSAWNGKGEKNEELVGGQKELDIDKDGDIEGDDLADLRASKNESVSTELPTAAIPSAVKAKLIMALDRIKDAKLNNNQKLQLVAQFVDSLGVDKSQLGTITNKIRSKMEAVQTELTFKTGKAAQAYRAKHKVRPGTKISISGVKMPNGHSKK
jgi:septum formation inhibitor MinC